MEGCLLTLREARTLFSNQLADLINHINGTEMYTCTVGEVTRSDEQAAINALKEEGRNRLAAYLAEVPEFQTLAMAVSNNGKGNGILLSVHRDGLGCDINLYKAGVYCEGAEEHRQFGEWWEAQYELCRWGGRFKDANHYSFEWQGRK